MSFLVGEIVARVSADTSRFDSSISGVKKKGESASRDLSKSFDRIGHSMRRTGAIMTASLTAPILLGMRSAVKESALLEGALAKFDVVFGDMADETRAWVNEIRKNVPLSRREIVQSTAAMQDLLVPMGIARGEATGMTKDWFELAAALAAFNDVPVDQALEAIRSGIAGQSRPLRQFGIDVRETAIQQKALSMGLIEAGQEMSEQVRQQALLAQAYANSKDAIDGYQDQLGTTLMMEQELSASYKDTLATLGKDLQPMYNSIVSTLTDVLRSFNELDSTTRKNILRAAGLAAALGPGLTILGQMAIMLPKVTKGFRALTAAMVANPYLAVGAAILGLATHIFLVNKRAKELNETIDNVLGSGIESQSLDQLNDLIVQMEQRIEKFRRQGLSMGIDPEDYPILQDLNAELDKLIDRRDKIAMRDLDKIISDKAIDNVESASEGVREIEMSINRLKPVLENTRPISEIIDPEEIWQAAENFRIMSQDINDIVARWENADNFGETLPTPEEQKSFIDFSHEGARLFDQMAFAGARFDTILKSILRQVASKAFGRALNFLLFGPAKEGASFLSSVFGGILGFAGGGNPPTGKVSLVGERGPELIAPRSASTVIPNHQLGQAQIDYNSMGRAFERALDRKLQRLSDREIFAMGKRGSTQY